MFTKVYDRGENKYRLICTQEPQHWKDEGSWHDIDMTIVNGRMDKNVYTLEFLTTDIGYSVVSRQDGSRIDVKLKSIGSKTIPYSKPVFEGNIAMWRDIDKDVDFYIELRTERVRCWKVLKTAEAAKDITFIVIEDEGDKEIRVVEEAVGHDSTYKPSIQSVTTTTAVKSVSLSTGRNLESYELTQTFEDKVKIVLEEEKRIKAETYEVTYPVFIDADISVSVSSDVNDGFGFYKYMDGSSDDGVDWNEDQDPIIHYTSSAYYSFYESRPWTRFDGITIPQTSTIDLALLKTYNCRTVANQTMYTKAMDEADSNNPTSWWDIRNTAKTSAGVSRSITNHATDMTPAPAEFDLYNQIVTTIVQELVNSYAYSSHAMSFIYHTNSTGSNYRAVLMYDRNRGTTKQARLEIDFTAPVPTGWGHDINTVVSANIAEVDEVATGDIAEINEV